jgi:hypothetical protein
MALILLLLAAMVGALSAVWIQRLLTLLDDITQEPHD